jgi:hypothetical protein
VVQNAKRVFDHVIETTETVSLTLISQALFHMHYNFVRIHQTLRVTPAMEAGLTTRLWSIQDLISLATSSLRLAA